MSVPVLVRTDTGKSKPGTATLIEHDVSKRGPKAAALAIGGLVAGACSAFIPVVHFVATWALPLLGFFLAWRVWSTASELVRIGTTCPGCDKTVELPGGQYGGGRMEEQCPDCMRPLTVERTSKESD
ncbi:MAG: hypothetical protein GY913_22815 [Proteobacteria bacterium]|nr:hypothetical protein [Pseudomonadota bacterium]MCP4919743.1 hypothetical protein [Pseudomonadota bacterium]